MYASVETVGSPVFGLGLQKMMMSITGGINHPENSSALFPLWPIPQPAFHAHCQSLVPGQGIVCPLCSKAENQGWVRLGTNVFQSWREKSTYTLKKQHSFAERRS